MLNVCSVPHVWCVSPTAGQGRSHCDCGSVTAEPNVGQTRGHRVTDREAGGAQQHHRTAHTLSYAWAPGFVRLVPELEAYYVPCDGAKERKELDKPVTEMEKENSDRRWMRLLERLGFIDRC